MLVALTISEDAIYPLIQSYVWAKIGAEPKVLKGVLDSFIRVCLGSCVKMRTEKGWVALREMINIASHPVDTFHGLLCTCSCTCTYILVACIR